MPVQALTPWSGFRTSEPCNFLLSLHDASVMAFVGRLGHGGAICEGNLAHSRVGLKTRNGYGAVQAIPAYSLRLPKWRERGLPEVCLHPLAVPHLFVTEQVPRGDLLRLLGSGNEVVKCATIEVPLTQASVGSLHDYLGSMLGVSRFRITVQTNFNLQVRRAGA